MGEDCVIRALRVAAYTVPTTSPESDGTLKWESTTLVAVEVDGGGQSGFGISYADISTAALIEKTLAHIVIGENPLDTPRLWMKMLAGTRGTGRPGVSSMAVSAIDTAVWDLKGKLLGRSVADLIGLARDRIEAYGSGGFTSYTDDQMREQLGGWAVQGLPAVKMKIGRHPEDDFRRVRLAREIIGPECRLFVDANGAYSRKQALGFAEQFAECDVRWFEEPVPSDDLDGLRLLRDRAPGGMDIAAGEYGYQVSYFRQMLERQAVDVIQADGTRCGGVTGFLGAAGVADAFGMPLSAHTAPTLHAHLACATLRSIHVEYFWDHAEIERRFLDGAIQPVNGMLRPDRSTPGFGWEFRKADAERLRVY